MDDLRTYAPYCSNLQRATVFLAEKRADAAFLKLYKARPSRTGARRAPTRPHA